MGKIPDAMMPVRPSSNALLEKEKTPTTAQRYDRNAAISLQRWMPVRQKL
jgi:hypothetical protein